MATQKELELELELWQERAQGVQTHANLLNAQAQLLGVKSKECQDNIARLQAQINGGGVTGTGSQTDGGGVTGTGGVALSSATVVDAGGGPGEER